MPRNDDPVRAGPCARSARRPPTSGRRLGSSDDRHGRRTRPRRGAGRSSTGPPSSSTVARRARRPAASPPASVGERVGGDRRRGAARPRRARPSTHSSIRSSSSSPASLRRSWIARWQLAGVALGDAARASARCRCTTTRPSSWATAVPGRGVAWISTSSGASVTPPSVTEPSAWNSTSPVAGRGHHRRDRRPEPLADLRQERLDPPLDERRSRRR